MQGSAVPSEADGACISENNDEISPEILYRNEKENKPDCGLVRNITGYIETARLGANISSAFYSSGCFSASAGSISIVLVASLLPRVQMPVQIKMILGKRIGFHSMPLM